VQRERNEAQRGPEMRQRQELQGQRQETAAAPRPPQAGSRVISRPGVRPRVDVGFGRKAAPGYRSDEHTEILEERQPLAQQPASEFATPDETVKEVLMTPQTYGANNMGFGDENDLDIPTYLSNMKKPKP